MSLTKLSIFQYIVPGTTLSRNARVVRIYSNADVLIFELSMYYCMKNIDGTNYRHTFIVLVSTAICLTRGGSERASFGIKSKDRYSYLFYRYTA